MFNVFKTKLDELNPLVVGVSLLAIFFSYSLLAYRNFLPTGDLAEYLNNPFRVICGEIPYKNFWLLFPPGEVYLPAVVYKIFGLNIDYLFFVSGAISVSIGLASFVLGKIVFKDNFFSMLTACTAFFDGVTARYVGFFYIHMYFLLLLFLAFFTVKYLRKPRLSYLFWAGFFAGSALFFRFYLVGAAMTAAVITVIIHSKLSKTSFMGIVARLSAFLLGVSLLILPALFLGYLSEMLALTLREILFESVKHAKTMTLPYFELINDYPVHSIVPLILICISIWKISAGSLKKEDAVILSFFMLWGVLTLPKTFGRSDIHHLSLAITPMFFALNFMIQTRGLKKNSGNSSGFFQHSNRYFEIIAGSFLILFSIFFFGRGPIVFFKAISSLGEERYTVVTEHGTLYYKERSEAAAMDSVVRFIEKNSDAGDYIFVTPWHTPPLYVLTNRKNPTYYDSAIDLVLRPDTPKQETVVDNLIKKNVKIIVHRPGWGFDNREDFMFANACPVIQRFIESNYERAQKYGEFLIYLAPESRPTGLF